MRGKPYASIGSMKLPLPLLAVTILCTPQIAFAAGDAALGGKLFLQCRACHTVGPADGNGVGPNLYGVVGARAGAKPGYIFSPAMAKSGIVWNAKTLDAFLTRPMTAMPGTKMAFTGVANPKVRADLIAYLATLMPAKR
jgi:cytochrome c